LRASPDPEGDHGVSGDELTPWASGPH
jgi:hypothetical protein